jgi:hypothetical protein
MVATANFCSAGAADDPKSAARARLERIQSLRKERQNDGVLIFYDAITRIGLGERDAALALLRTLKGAKTGSYSRARCRFRIRLGRPGVSENSQRTRG